MAELKQRILNIIQQPLKPKHYLQIQGTAEMVAGHDDKDVFRNETLKNIFKGPDDPNCGVMIVKPYHIELNTVGSFEPEAWEA